MWWAITYKNLHQMYICVQLYFMHVIGGLMMGMLNDAYNLYVREDCEYLLWKSYSFPDESRLLNTLHYIMYHNIILHFFCYYTYKSFWQQLTQLAYCVIIYVPLQVSYYRIFVYVESIFPIVYTSCTDCLLCSHYHVFDLNIPYCICPHPRDATTQRYIFFCLHSASFNPYIVNVYSIM